MSVSCCDFLTLTYLQATKSLQAIIGERSISFNFSQSLNAIALNLLENLSLRMRKALRGKQHNHNEPIAEILTSLTFLVPFVLNTLKETALATFVGELLDLSEAYDRYMAGNASLQCLKQIALTSEEIFARFVLPRVESNMEKKAPLLGCYQGLGVHFARLSMSEKVLPALIQHFRTRFLPGLVRVQESDVKLYWAAASLLVRRGHTLSREFIIETVDHTFVFQSPLMARLVRRPFPHTNTRNTQHTQNTTLIHKHNTHYTQIPLILRHTVLLRTQFQTQNSHHFVRVNCV